MQDKQKVTLYLPPELYRKLKIQAAVDMENMSGLAEKAIAFYLSHSDVVESVEAATQGQVHRVYHCPDCSSQLLLREGEMVTVQPHPAVFSDRELSVPPQVNPEAKTEEKLVPC